MNCSICKKQTDHLIQVIPKTSGIWLCSECASPNNAMPTGYFVQNGCCCCIHVFRREDYDEHDMYYCHFDKSERPKCGSVLENENVSTSEERDVWRAWAKSHEVHSCGICREFQKQV